jgi:hypothetical protein
MKLNAWFAVVGLGCLLGCSGSASPGSANGAFDDDGGSSGSTSGATSSGATGSSGGTNPSASGAGSSGGGGGSSGGAAGTSSSGSAGASGGGTSGSSSSSGAGGAGSEGGIVSGEAGLTDNPDIDYSVAPVTLTMSTFTVQPGDEVYYCQNFANPWGEQVDIKTYQLDMGVGSHHMFAFYASGATDGAIAPCPSGGLTFGAFTFTAQDPTLTQTYPQSVGATIPSGTGFQMMVHYLNTTGSPITSAVKLTMYIAKPGVVTNHAGVLYLNQVSMTVPASCTSGCESSQSYTLSQDVNLLSSGSHMHKYGTNFVSTTSTGVTLYQTTQWADPPGKVYSPPLQLSSGTSITWTCTDVNATGEELTFGESAETNVMCISVSIFYPVTDVTNPVLGTSL